MAASFLHGVETIEIDKGARPVRLVKSSVVGLIGTSTTGAINQNILVSKEADIAQFSDDGTLKRELLRLFAQKPTVCIVRNVYDASVHSGGIDTVGAADIIGTVVSATGKRTGLLGFKDAYQELGFFPKMVIAPGFSSLGSVRAHMDAVATNMRAIAFADAPIGVTVQQAIGGRGALGAINFATSSARMGLCYPHVKTFDTARNAEVLGPLSTVMAGAWSRRDQEHGYWWSGSNLELLGVSGVERPIEAMLNDPNCEANVLNEAGIITVFNSFGTGIRSWGNRSAAWPSSSHQSNFLNVRRTADVIFESMEYATLQFMDQPLDSARIDDILETGNRFLRHQQANGAIAGGKVWLLPDENTAESLAAGHLQVGVDFAPYSPLERVTFKGGINSDYLQTLLGGK